jgi:hypothetical protein
MPSHTNDTFISLSPEQQEVVLELKNPDHGSVKQPKHSTEKQFQFSPKTQQRILGVFLWRLEAWQEFGDAIKPSWFVDGAHQHIFRFVRDFQKQHGGLPDEKTYINHCQITDKADRAYCISQFQAAVDDGEFEKSLGKSHCLKLLRDFITDVKVKQATGTWADEQKRYGPQIAFENLKKALADVAETETAIKLWSPSEIRASLPITWQIPEHWPTNGLVTIFGSAGSYKSFLALHMGCCICTGTDYFGRAVQQGKVLYIASEGGTAGLKQRLPAWEEHFGITVSDDRITFITTQHDLQDWTEASSIIEAAKRHLKGYPTIIIIDTLSRNFGAGDTDKTVDMRAYLKTIDKIREQTGATVVNIHHTGWAELKRESGAKALRNYCDTSILVEKDQDNNITISCKKQKDAAEFDEYYLAPVQVGNSLVLKSIELDKEQEVYKRVPTVADPTLGVDPLAICASTNIPLTTVKRYLKKHPTIIVSGTGKKADPKRYSFSPLV